MPNRREFLQTGAAVSAMAFNGLLTGSASAAGRYYVVPQRAIYDDRYPEGHTFAAFVAAQGVSAQALDAGDVTRFYLELDAVWRRESVAVAGLTQFGPLFVIEQLAAEHRMRVAHRAVVDGTFSPLTSRPRDPLVAVGAASSIIHYYAPLAIQQGHDLPLDGPLYSWLIAPRAGG